MAVAEDGTPYWCDRANGIGTLDARDRPRYLSEADGIVSNSIWELHIDRQGDLWASGKGGVSVRRQGQWTRFGMEHGLPVEGVWPVIRAGNQVCLGLACAGIGCLDQAAAPDITRVRIVNVAEEDGAVTATWQAASAFGHLAPQSIETRYRFDGDSRSEWANREQIRRAGLTAGAHRLEVESQSMGPGWRAATQTFPVKGSFYSRAAFLAPVGLSLATALALLATLVSRTRQARLAMQMREHHYRSLIETGWRRHADQQGISTNLRKPGDPARPWL